MTIEVTSVVNYLGFEIIITTDTIDEMKQILLDFHSRNPKVNVTITKGTIRDFVSRVLQNKPEIMFDELFREASKLADEPINRNTFHVELTRMGKEGLIKRTGRPSAYTYYPAFDYRPDNDSE